MEERWKKKKLWRKRNRLTQMLTDIERHIYQYSIYGNIPIPIFKAFDERAHAENFCSGEVWFNFLEHYKKLENDGRADRTEGRGLIRVDGEMLTVNTQQQTLVSGPGIENHVFHAFENSHLICCFSLHQNGSFNHLPRERFGRWYVKIKNPFKFIRMVAYALTQNDQLKVNSPYLDVMRIVYNKDKYVGRQQSDNIAQRLTWAQKPESYADEWEYRLHIHISLLEQLQLDNGYFKIRIGDISDYCEIIERRD